MYNRYLQHDGDCYEPVSEPPPRPESPNREDGVAGLFRNLLDKVHLDHIDTGDLLLLGLLFFLYREKADEELLAALALLLIL